MHREGLIPFKSSTDQAMASLYFLRILINFCSFSTIKSAAIITGCALSAPKKANFRCLGTSFRINPLKLFSTSSTLSSLLLDFYRLCSIISFLYCFFQFKIEIQKFNCKILNILEIHLILIH